MTDRIVKIFTSLRLTVVLLVAAVVLVFVGTLAQVHEGLYLAQERYFKSWYVFMPTIGNSQVPILLPGGYLIGTLLIINLLAAHIKRFQFTRKKLGIHLTHGGLILLLLGQLLTDVLSTESAMRLAEGDSKNYSVDFRHSEVVVIDKSDPERDAVIAIPEEMVEKEGEIRHSDLPVTLKVTKHWPNSEVRSAPTSNSIPLAATRGIGRGRYLVPFEPTVSMDERNIPSALVEVIGSEDSQSLGTWLLTCQSDAKQTFEIGDKTYEIAFRFKRHYKPFSLKLLEFTHDRYPGTDKPRNFASRVRIQRPETGEDREVEIYMNHPLRYGGETYYQASFDAENDRRVNKVTILQVVRNPGWLTPYLACTLMGVGMLVQFCMHLFGFATRWRRT